MTLKLTKNARIVLEKRYLKKDEKGQVIETPEEMFWRVAKNIASAEKIYKPDISEEELQKIENEFYEIMVNLEFLPNSPTLMNAGRPLQQLSACFVLPVGDSMEEIFEAIKATAIIHKTGGGTGFSFSRLRPKGARVKTTSGVSSGPIAFMKVFNEATEAVKQGGTRRGANMGILRVDHPDILDFIKCKEQEGVLANFNISVALTKEFMKALKNDKEYDLIEPHTGKIVRSLKAKEVFDMIVNYAWKNGEPGIIFLDHINAANPTPEIGEIESTNPCGEQPLLPYESCNLGSINLAKMVENDEINWGRLEEVVRIAVRFLDNVIDMNKFPLPQIEEMTKANRKIGLGVMGFADMLIQLGIPYNSEEALNIAEKVMRHIYIVAAEFSKTLASWRGVFPNWEKSIYKHRGEYYGEYYYRNATLTTIAPTGTLSIIAGCSSGIEPLYAIIFEKHVLGGERLLEINPYFEKIAKERGFYSEELMEKVAQKTSIQDIEEIPEEIRKIFVTAHDISPEWHIKMQAAFQKYVDNAVSKTINFPNSATQEDIKKAYLFAYELGCKGVTIYRDRSREEQVFNVTRKKLEIKVEDDYIVPAHRPRRLEGVTYCIESPRGNVYVTVNFLITKDGVLRVYETFATGKDPEIAGVSRVVSKYFQIYGDPREIIYQLWQVTGTEAAANYTADGRVIFVSSINQAFALGLAWAIFGENFNPAKEDPRKKKIPKITLPLHGMNINVEKTSQKESDLETKTFVGICPDCGANLIPEEGCLTCHSCGFSKCF